MITISTIPMVTCRQPFLVYFSKADVSLLLSIKDYFMSTNQGRPSPKGIDALPPPCFRFPSYFQKLSKSVENFHEFYPFSPKNLSFYPPKFLMTFLVIYSKFVTSPVFPEHFSHFGKKLISPYFYNFSSVSVRLMCFWPNFAFGSPLF